MTTFTARRFDTSEVVRIQVHEGRIKSILPVVVSSPEAEALPFVGPGLFDIQLNGFRGIWFSSDRLTVDEVEEVIHAYAEQGITRCFPTLITNSREAIEHGLRIIRAARERSQLVRTVVAGCHIEGPYISPQDGPRGAHPLVHVRPADASEFSQWQLASGGLIRLVTLAPEVPGALSFIERVASTGVVVAIGHSAASADIIRQAADCGARLSTHLGNGCSAMIPRHDNIFWPQLADDRLTCSVIADGWHVPATMLNCILRCKTLLRMLLTSDVSGFGGCPPGPYSAGDIDVEVLSDGRIVVAGQTQFLAGSGATTGECVAHLMMACGVPLADAWPLASSQPAGLLRIPTWSVREGDSAHLTVFRLTTTRSIDGREERLKYQPDFCFAGGIRIP